jgi:NAD(P)-dependent dehydrogenase (short-subunit alcohol dehydrogenase family)
MDVKSSAYELSGAVVLVTGGAKGIGCAIAEGFLREGATVVVCGRTAPVQLPSQAGATARFIACDVRDPQAVSGMFVRIAEEQGRLDVLVNNAGGSPAAPAAEASPRFTEKIVQLNLLGPLYCAQSANALMQRQESGGCIINIASVSGVRPSPGTAAYGAAKAGLLHVTETLAIEWGPRVRVNAIIAGLIQTPAADEHYGGSRGLARIEAMLPLRRLGTGSDVAAACLYLASPLARYVSGAKLAVHGGGEPPAFLYLAASQSEQP